MTPGTEPVLSVAVVGRHIPPSPLLPRTWHERLFPTTTLQVSLLPRWIEGLVGLAALSVLAPRSDTSPIAGNNVDARPRKLLHRLNDRWLAHLGETFPIEGILRDQLTGWIEVGDPFLVREHSRIVGRGVVTKTNGVSSNRQIG